VICLDGSWVDGHCEDHTVTSSTDGEERRMVKNRTLMDSYGDRGVYTGTVLRSTGLPHGIGRIVYEDDGRIYDGDWRHGKLESARKLNRDGR
jgi:hypothetical protein